MRNFIRHNLIISVSCNQRNAADSIGAGSLRHVGSLCHVGTLCVPLFQHTLAIRLRHFGLKHDLPQPWASGSNCEIRAN